MAASAGPAAPALAPAPAPSSAAPAAPAPAPSSSQRSGDVMGFAAALAVQPCPLSRPIPGLWGMLTAVSHNARKRHQGSHIMLQHSEHVLGRIVREVSCVFDSPNVSARHCTVSRRFLGLDGRLMPPNHIPNPATDRLVACIRDSSSNGTYINFERLQRNGEEVQLRHGDVISLVGTPENTETAFSFVYREVSHHTTLASVAPGEGSGLANKRKDSPPDDLGDTVGGDVKRIKGLGSGGVSGPIMLNDVRQLQRSNEELRVLVEMHMLEVEKLRSEYRNAETRHASELKDVQRALAEKFSAQQEELKLSLAAKELDLETSATLRLQQESSIELLQQRLASEAKSRVDAEEVIDGLKSRVEELEKLLEEERSKISKERAEAEASLRAALDRIRTEAAENLKRYEEAAVRQQEQQNDIILALQEGEKEYRAAAEISRKKLDWERAAVVAAEERARRLEAQLQEEKVLSLSAHNRAEDFEVKLQQTCKELEDEKKAREGAQTRIAMLEVEMEAACRDLKLEKQRLEGARERIVLRETQLRAFHSTAAEIAALQQRQQDQLSMMIRTLEDGDSDNDHDNTNVRSTSLSTKAHPDLLHYSEHQSSKRIQKVRRTSQSTSGSRPVQVDVDGNMRTKHIEVQGDEKSKGTAIDDDTEGDTQQDDCSNASHSATRSSDINIPPTQIVAQTGSFDGLKVGGIPASTYGQAGYLHGKAELLHFTNADMGCTQLENGEVGCTQIAIVDTGCTQLNHEADLEDASGRARCEVAGANQGRSTGLNGVPTVNRDEPMEEETAHPDNMGVRTCYLLDSTGHWDEEDRGITRGTLRAEPAFRESMTDSRRYCRDSLCTADLLASEVAGSWAMATPATADGENDSSSAERYYGKEENRRISDDGAEYAASQVATNNVPGEKHPEGNAACNEGKIPNEVDGNADVDIDMSQTTPKQNLPSVDSQGLQQQGAGNKIPNIAASGVEKFPEVRRHVVRGGGSSSDTSSTEDGSREDGEIGASELRDSEPGSPLMYAQ